MQEMIIQEENACGMQADTTIRQVNTCGRMPGPCFPVMGPGILQVSCAGAPTCPNAGACAYGFRRDGTAAVPCAGAFPGPDFSPGTDTRITEETIKAYEMKLREEEKAMATIAKYVSSIRKVKDWLGGREISRTVLLDYRDELRSDHTVSSVNGVISAINSYLEAFGLSFLKMKLQKVQKKLFRPAEKEMTMEDYEKLLRKADELGLHRLVMIMQTICATGIRVSELAFITVEAAKARQAEVTLKGKTRLVAVPKDLATRLLEYAKEHKIASGKIFLTRNGTPVSRKQIWAEMKALSEKTGVPASKIFPHNLRHLFAQRYYQESHDIETLSDTLGHSNIETTRIYLASDGEEHRRIVESLGLVLI